MESEIRMELFRDINYEKNILYKMQNFQNMKTFCDAIVISGDDGRRINVHRIVLSASSDYFAALFAGDARTNNQMHLNEFILKEVDGNILELFINFFYSGCIEINTKNVESLLMVSQKFQLSQLTEACIEFISKEINACNFINIFSIADRVKSKKLEKDVYEFLYQNFKEISKSKQFLQLTSAQLCRLIKSDELNVTSEEEVFNALMFWYKYDVKKRKSYIAGFLIILRISELSTEFINKYVRPLCEAHGCQEILLETFAHRLMPNEPTKTHEHFKKRRSSQKTNCLLFVGWSANLGGSEILLYSSKENNWRFRETISHDELYSCCLWNQKLYLNTITSIICLNIQTGKKEYFETFKKERKFAKMIVFKENLYVLGGQNNIKTRCKTVEKWNLKTHEWTEAAHMETDRAFFGIVVFKHLLYVVGGVNTKFLKSTECFNSQTNSWNLLSEMNERRCSPGVTNDNRFIYAVGGKYSNTEYLKTVECYDPQINKWTLMSNTLNDPRYSLACAFYNECIFIVGGWNDSPMKTMEIYDIDIDKWIYGTSLPKNYSRHYLFQTSAFNDEEI